MIKIRTIVFLLFSLTFVCSATGMMLIHGQKVAGTSCDSCTGGLIFSWYCNTTTVGDTGYSPCGCSAGDTSGAANDSCTVHDSYVDSADAGKYINFDVSSDDIWIDTVGSMLIDFQVDTWVNGADLFAIFVDVTDRFRLYLTSDDELVALHEGNDNDVFVSTSSVSTVVTGQRYFVVARWTSADVDPNLKIEVYNSSETLVDDNTSNTNLSAFDNVPSAGSFFVGNRTGEESAIRIYKIKVWTTYDGAPTSGF